MATSKPPADPSRLNRALEDARRHRAERESTYREQALKLYPWICGRCGREFSGARVRELTVHHRDHNHDNNPSDGSNWELLCLYCHDNEHTKFHEHILYGSTKAKEIAPATFNPFAQLKDLMDKKN